MVDQATLEMRNGAHQAPATEILRGLNDCAHDVVTLTELQMRLLKLDLQDSARQTRAPLGLLAVGLCLLLGSFPVLLMTIAYGVVALAGWPQWAGFLTATVVGFLIGGGLSGGAYWLFRHNVTGLQRSRKELVDNIRWLKETLSSGGRSRHRRQCG
ncbi:MAG: phage holin family protein [Rhodopirellula sp.]|nr:phage holin family protein [Rhodopirellula sp.]